MLDKQTETQALHGILADGRTAQSIAGEIQADLADIVEAGLDARAEFTGQAAERIVAPDFGVQTISLAVIELLELIAVGGIEGIGEVREQVELVVERVGIRREAPGSQRPRNLEVERVTMRFAAVGGIDVAEAVQQARVEGALRNLVGGIPAAVVTGGGQ